MDEGGGNCFYQRKKKGKKGNTVSNLSLSSSSCLKLLTLSSLPLNSKNVLEELRVNFVNL